jgi:outer membrane murein-binding lipoprotein Lpp
MAPESRVRMAVPLAIVAIVVTRVAASTPEEAKGDKMAAVEKVASMLEDLQKQVLEEGAEEAKTYDQFACFCKDNIKDKQESITSGKDEKAKLSTAIDEGAAERDKLDGEIKDLLEEIKKAEEEIAKAKKENKKAVEEYTINSADLKNALDGLEGAIGVLKANKAKTPSFVQLPEGVAETIQSATIMADALGLASGAPVKQMLGALLQKASAPSSSLVAATSKVKKIEPYAFHADDIITTLEKLQTDFKKEKTDVDEAEAKRVAAYEKFLEEKEKFVKTKEGEVDEKREKKAKVVSQLATDSKDFSGVSAQLLDDMDYLKELAQICGDKAKTWDVRSKTRRDEIAAITSAITIVRGAISEKTSKATVRLLEQKFSAKVAAITVRDEDAMESAEADAERMEESEPASTEFAQIPLAFLQRKQRSPHFGLDGLGWAERNLQKVYDHAERMMPARPHDAEVKTQSSASSSSPSLDAGREAVTSLLRKQGVALHSSMLSALATQIEKDPFAKVKKLIQELIERMLQQAANDANQKGWCDKAIGDAEQKRGYIAEKIEELNSDMAEFEARRDSLTEELQVLAKEIEKLKKAQEDADKARAKEKSENAATVKEAQEGLSAVKEAIQILDRFYKTAAKEKVDLELIQGPKDDAPDAGFESGEAYKGAQGDAKGVIGMLEVIESDFERTVRETEKAEAEAEDDYLKFTTETQSSLAKKEEATKLKTADLDETKESLDNAKADLTSKTDSLVSTIKELLELQPACVDTGMTYEEREAARQAEIDALHKALCIFNAYEEFGPDGAGSSC